jgi:hypothetical protein
MRSLLLVESFDLRPSNQYIFVTVIPFAKMCLCQVSLLSVCSPTDVKNISLLVQLLEQIAKQQYEIKALAESQVKVRPKTSESYRRNTKGILFSVQTVKDMGTPKIIAISNRDA